MNTQEPPSQNPIATSGQPKEKQAQDATTKIDSTVIVTTSTEEKDKEKTWQIDTSDPIAQSQGAPPRIIIIDQGRREEDKGEEKSPKEKEQEVI